jgi:VWFA-related protein
VFHMFRSVASFSACALIFLGLALSSAVVSAQAPAPPTFPSGVELITVDAVVVDAKGKPVTGLTRDDFVVEEDGKPQDIVTFEAVSLPPEPAPDARANAAEPPPVATNAGVERKAGRVFALLADDLRLPGAQSLQLRQAMAHFIDKSLGPGDAVLLGTTSGEAWWSARIPEGREDLHSVLDRVKGRYVDPRLSDQMTEYEAFYISNHESGTESGDPDTVSGNSGPFERVVLRLWDKDVCGSKQPTKDIRPCWPVARSTARLVDAARQDRVRRVLRAMERGLNALATQHGHTSLVFFSPGFLQDNDVTDGVATAALRAHTAVYFVDVRGLETGIESASAEADLSARENPSNATQKQFEQLNLESGGAEALAEETGGFSVRNTNDLAAAGERVAAESRTFYLLGIHPPAGKKADAWRKLRVTVRRDGLTTRARRGYRSGTIVQSAAALPIPLRLASYVLGPVAEKQTRVVAVAEVDISGLGSAGNTEGGDSGLQMRLEAMPRNGGQTQVQDASLQLTSGNTGERSQTASSWRLARFELALPAGVHGIRIFLLDPKTGRTGAVDQRIVVPEPAAFRLSTPVLSDQVTASRAVDAPVSPALVAHDNFAPRPDRPLLATFEVFGAAKDPTTGHGRIESQFVLKDGGGRPLAAPPASPLDPSSEGRWQQVIALPPLPGGDYDLSMTVRDRLAGNERTAHRTFKIDGTPAAVMAPEPARSEPAKPVSAELAAILDRAGRYVLAYERDLSNVLAEEECRQILGKDDPSLRKVRDTRAGAFFITLPGALPWATFRDVWEVDGNKIRDHEERLGRLFQGAPGSGASGARAILEESARYNLGPRRTVNIPTLALLFLHPDNQHRFDFELKGKASLQGTATVEVAFRERVRPPLVAGGTPDGAPAQGRFWIDPERGAVLKTDVTYDTDPRDSDHRSHARIVTEYRSEAKLGILVPDRMKETYEWPAFEAPRLHNFQAAQEESRVVTLEANAGYSGYRRFQVTTEERYRTDTETPH